MNDLMEESHTATGARQEIPRLLGAASGWGKLPEIEDRLFTEHNLKLYGFGVAAIYAFIVGWLLCEVVLPPNGKLASIDFCWIWVSGKFAMSSDPVRIYDPVVLSAVHNALFHPDECLFQFRHQYVYPPTFLFFTYALGLMPYLAAFATWIAATLVLYEAAIYAIIPRPAALIAAIAAVAVPLNIVFGQNGFLTAGLIGLSLVFVERRPWLSGVFLGLLTYKLQFGVLFPIALLASRNWRALGGATATSVMLGVAAAIAFGYQGWPSFINTLIDRNSGLSPDGHTELRLQTIYGLLHWAGAGAWISWTVHLTVAAIVAVTVYAVWAKPIPHSLKAAILSIGAVTVTPYVLPYDLCILSVAGAFLVRDGMSGGFLPGERTGVLICFAGLFPVATPIAPMICAILFFLTARRIVAYGRDLLTVSRDEPVVYGLSRTASLQ
jgi:arabinofuranan 3-O-arabinosyltransferase